MYLNWLNISIISPFRLTWMSGCWASLAQLPETIICILFLNIICMEIILETSSEIIRVSGHMVYHCIISIHWDRTELKVITILKWHLACLWISCVRLREEDPQTAFPMSCTWTSHIATSVHTGSYTLPNQSMLSQRLLIKIRNNKRPSIEPCGVSESKGF